MQRSYAAVKANILKSADKMPAADYSYKPTPEVRTYARVLNHVTEAQANSCGAANGTPADARVKAPAETADKATIVAALNASFAECDKAFAALTDANALEMVDLGRGKRSRIGLMWGDVATRYGTVCDVSAVSAVEGNCTAPAVKNKRCCADVEIVKPSQCVRCFLCLRLRGKCDCFREI